MRQGQGTTQVGAENKYGYNGKELNDDHELNLHDYGFRWYDASIGRFTSIDPLAEDYTFQTPYAYAINNPITFIDFLGLGPIYGPDGETIVGYEVEDGQGPTQVAQDLNENYDCKLTCEVSFEEIVYNNIEQFQNVVDGDGQIDDKYNGDYESGNIAPGDVLVITNGIDQTEVKAGEIEENINRLKGDVNHLENRYDNVMARDIEELKAYQALSAYDGYEDGKVGGTMGFAIGQQRKHGATLGGISHDLKEKNDSISIYREKLKELKPDKK